MTPKRRITLREFMMDQTSVVIRATMGNVAAEGTTGGEIPAAEAILYGLLDLTGDERPSGEPWRWDGYRPPGMMGVYARRLIALSAEPGASSVLGYEWVAASRGWRHETARVHRRATLGDEVVIMPEARVGKAIIERRVVVPEGARIARHATIAEDVRIGEKARIGAGTFVYGGATIGTQAVVGPRCEIHRNVRIGPRCEIGADCFIGEGNAIPANSRISRYSHLSPV